MIDAAQVVATLALLAPGFVALKTFYLVGLRTKRSDAEWAIWSVVASVPIGLLAALLSQTGFEAVVTAKAPVFPFLAAALTLAVAIGIGAAIAWACGSSRPLIFSTNSGRPSKAMRPTVGQRMLVAVMGVFMAGCQLGPGATPTAKVEALPLAEADYIGLAWLPSGEIVVGLEVPPQPEGIRVGEKFAIANRTDGSLRDLVIPADERCWREDYFSPRALPDGRLGFIHVCLHSINGEPPDEAEVMAMDVGTGVVETIMPLATLTVVENVQFSVPPRLGRVIYQIGAGLCAGIAIATAGSPEGRFHVRVEGDGKSFFLDTPADLHRSCNNAGRAAAPALSPDSKTLAFLASPASVGVPGGTSRLGLPWNLYVMDLESQVPRQLVGGLTGIGETLSWSPDGTRLAFLADIPGMGGGAWLVDVGTGSLRLLTQDDLASPTWSPDGSQILALRGLPHPGSVLRAQVVLLSLTGHD